jgi:hypothetical protein
MTSTESGLPPERCRQIARWVLGAEASEEQVAEFAANGAKFVAEMPPPTQEQLDTIAVLLRPGPGEPGRSSA